MPIYEYACGACNHTLDALQKISEDPLKFCPECGAESLRKLISAPNFRLKGKGWYETDFKTGDRKNIAGDSAPDGGKKDGQKDAQKDGQKAGDKGSGEGGKKEGKKDAGKSTSSDTGATSSSKSGGKASASAASPAK